MRLTRRTALAALGGAAVIGIGFTVGTGLKAAANDIIARNFGEAIASTEDAKNFIHDVVTGIENQSRSASLSISGIHRLQQTKILKSHRISEWFEEYLVTAFVTSTNVAQVYPHAEDFYYLGLFDPYNLSCGNQLSATFLV